MLASFEANAPRYRLLLLLATYYSLLATYYLLRTGMPLTTCYLLLTTHYLLLATHRDAGGKMRELRQTVQPMLEQVRDDHLKYLAVMSR